MSVEIASGRTGRVLRLLEKIRNRIEAYSSGDRDARFEAEHTLGAEPTRLSGTGWGVRHPSLDSDIRYESYSRGDIEISPEQLVDGDFWPSIVFKTNTCISPHPYTDTKGRRRIIFDVKDNPFLSGKVVDEKLVRIDQLNDGVDSSVIVFERQTAGSYYFQIREVRDHRIILHQVSPVRVS